jgi:hypothetical protein
MSIETLPDSLAHDPRVHRVDGALTSTSLRALDPVALAEAGYETVLLTEPVVLGRDDEFDLRFLHLLREAMSVILRVDWSTEAPAPFELSMVAHLQPPRSGAPFSREWSLQHRFGLCYYRLGPGFVLLRDTRDAEDGARYRLEHPEAVVSWSELEPVRRLSGLSASTRGLYDLLTGEDMVLRCGEWVTVLPYRLRRWPVPFDAV